MLVEFRFLDYPFTIWGIPQVPYELLEKGLEHHLGVRSGGQISHGKRRAFRFDHAPS